MLNCFDDHLIVGGEKTFLLYNYIRQLIDAVLFIFLSLIQTIKTVYSIVN